MDSADAVSENTTKLRLHATTLFGVETLSEETDYSYEPSGITTITTVEDSATAPAYTIDGRSVKNSSTTRGIIILNDGTKVIRTAK